MLDVQRRVIEEKSALDDKITRLTDFLENDPTADVTIKEADMLLKQLDYMKLYSGILAERIAAFSE